jgi:hypothetical protein
LDSIGNQLADLNSSRLAALSKSADLGGYDCEASAMLACTGCFDCGI